MAPLGQQSVTVPAQTRSRILKLLLEHLRVGYALGLERPLSSLASSAVPTGAVSPSTARHTPAAVTRTPRRLDRLSAAKAAAPATASASEPDGGRSPAASTSCMQCVERSHFSGSCSGRSGPPPMALVGFGGRRKSGSAHTDAQLALVLRDAHGLATTPGSHVAAVVGRRQRVVPCSMGV